MTFCCSKQLNHTFLLSSLTRPSIVVFLVYFLLVVVHLVVSTSTDSRVVSLITEVSCYVQKDVELFLFIQL